MSTDFSKKKSYFSSFCHIFSENFSIYLHPLNYFFKKSSVKVGGSKKYTWPPPFLNGVFSYVCKGTAAVSMFRQRYQISVFIRGRFFIVLAKCVPWKSPTLSPALFSQSFIGRRWSNYTMSAHAHRILNSDEHLTILDLNFWNSKYEILKSEKCTLCENKILIVWKLCKAVVL